MKKAYYVALLSFSSVAFALQGGPSQPDYIQFEPSELQDMVNLQTGNFTYSIPLGELPGAYGNFPLSMSYHAGITPQQEASWVGLGWTLNPGAINRDLRGVPDDQFHGGTLGFVYQYAAWHYWNLNFGYGYGAFSVGMNVSSSGGVGMSYSAGFKLGEYAGVGFTVSNESFGLNARVGALNQSLAFSTSNGSISGSTTLSVEGRNVGASIGASYGQGQKTAYNVGFSVSGHEDVKNGAGNVVGTKTNTMKVGLSSGGVSVSGTQSLYDGNGKFVSESGVGTTVNVANSVVSGKGSTSTRGFNLFVPTPYGTFSFGFNDNIYEYHMRSATSDYVYGYMYQAGPAIVADGDNNIIGMPQSEIGSAKDSKSDMKWSWTLKGRNLEKLGDHRKYPAYDLFNVSSEGASGSFRLFPREEHQIYELISDSWTVDDGSVESYSPLTYGDQDFKPYAEEFKFDSDGSNIKSEYSSYEQCLNDETCSPYARYATNIRNEGNRFVYRKNKSNVDTISSGMNFLFVGEGGYYKTSDLGSTKAYDRKHVSKDLLYRTVGNREYALYGSRKIEPIFEDDSPVGSLKGFVITASNGNKYIFGQPVKSYLKVDYSINKEKGAPVFVDQSTSISNSNFFVDFAKGYWDFLKGVYTLYYQIGKSVVNFFAKKGHLNETCTSGADEKEKVADLFFSYQVNMNPYATQWLLTEIQGADYIDLGEKSIGYNVKFKYTKPSIYRWRTPYGRPGLSAADLPNFRMPSNGFTPEGCDSRMYQASFGVKEYVYLESIETSTHKVKFVLNDSALEERVDGKGWEKGLNPENGYSDIPIFVQSNLQGKVKKEKKVYSYYTEKWCVAAPAGSHGGGTNCIKAITGEEIIITPEYLYFSTPVPDVLKKVIQNKKTIMIGNFNTGNLPDGSYSPNELEKVRKQMTNFNMGEYSLLIDENTEIEPVTDEKSKYGLFRVKLSANNSPIQAYSFVENSYDGKEIVLGEAGVGEVYPLIEWSNIIFDNSVDEVGDNQSRYLKSIVYYNKNDTNHAYQIFDFKYDYSLQPKTLNSYCSGKYPKSNEDILNSPDTASVDVCSNKESGSSETGAVEEKNYLYGKLTLKSISERGCRNGKCSYLPPFKFEYNSPSLTSTRLSTKDGWVELSQQKVSGSSNENAEYQYPASYYENLSDVDASIIASSNVVDDWGMWNMHATSENHKVDQSFADYGASAWSLNKVVDPAGGIMEVSYERDSYQNGEDFASEKRYVEIVGFEKCSSYSDYQLSNDDRYKDKLCVEIGQLYWREQCLGPREAFWDTKKPMGFNGSGFEYLDSMGVDVRSGNTHVMLNLTSAMDTEVDCGPFGWGSCDRTRSVAVVTEGAVIAELNAVSGKNLVNRLIVIDNAYELIDAGLKEAAYRITEDQSWSSSGKDRKGFMWSRQEFESMKGGDLRVKQISRTDIDRTTRSEYDYSLGELALLPDSSFTTVLGNRFFGDKVSFALPNVGLKPKSRIVGFDDDDLLYLPGSGVSYPMVSVKNTDSQGKTLNGTTVFKYITPESGVPKAFIDPSTLAILKPFLKVNAVLFNYEGSHLDKDYDYRSFYAEIELLDEHKQQISGIDLLNVLIAQNKSNSYMFYADNIKEAKYLRVSVKYKNNEPMLSDIFVLDDLTEYNEVAVALNLNLSKKGKKLTLKPMWARSHKEGFVPILYRSVKYGKEKFQIQEIGEKTELTDFANFEQSIVYHDLTSFLGLNYEISYYRGTNENSVKIKSVKNVYSTKAPSVAEDVADDNNDIANKVGVQIEKWAYETQLHCETYDGKEDAGKKNQCMTKYAPLYERVDSKKKDHGKFEYVRYPAFLISTKTTAGYDNQNGVERNVFTETSMDNHRFDPLTGSPTATVARTVISREKGGKTLEMRKLTVKHPHYSIKENGKSTVLADNMFLKNMISQNFYDAIYSGTVDSASSWNSIEINDSLRSFSFSPFRLIPDSLYKQNNRPIVAWGSYNSKLRPKEYLGNGTLLNALVQYQNGDNLPELERFGGTHIKSVDSNLKIVETRNVFGRVLSTHYSDDGMYQTSLFYPANISETASIVPVGKGLAKKNCEVEVSSVDLNKGGAVLSSKPICSVDDTNLVVEYRAFINGSWKRVRKKYSSNSLSSLTSGVILNYLRIYPTSAESKTFITDFYGNVVQIVAEDNLSTYYEYDPTGSLIQIRNDDGVSFKSHHREFRNDTLDNISVGTFIEK
ncbi:hypothetical protein SAMN05720766_13216 [Fibrobacter sp. UWH9]|uniref:hypothetical protein n=1 Tax=Fibrobacter sp. UWH9 TaxID=1896213 RepID=UPI0009181D55|nr:hypothetical protein [Fibrobacter sp. UWH9]SHH87908.1 hypothetical protein SAMN05720766_13216 [Fibrobacter sp. UWH9]